MTRWKSGQSGNPAGRPKGVIDRRLKFREALAKDLPAVLAAMLEAAKGGDTAAAKLILDRVIPPLRAVDLPVNVPLGPGLAEGGRAVLDRVGAGEITPEQGLRLLTGLAAQARLVEVDEIVSRLAKLEAQHDPD